MEKETNIPVSGFLVMDTNCFLKYISEQKVEEEKFDYDGVKTNAF